MSSLQWSEQGGGFTDDPRKALDEVYLRLVEKYVPATEQVSRDDDEIAKPFRARLGKALEKLKTKRIEAKDYQYEFRFAWQNSMWHLYEPVLFDLMDPNSIREKGVPWYGRGAALQEAREKFKIHFLLGEPRQPGTKDAFQNALHLLSKIPGEKEIVREHDIETLAEHVAEEVANHAGTDIGLREKPKNQ
jgi:hypothetical protein